MALPKPQMCRLGASRTDESTAEFLVWAPQARKLEVHLLGSAEHYFELIPIDRGYFHAVVTTPEACRYLYRIDGDRERPDPASRLQPDGVHGPSALVEREYPWTDAQWQGVDQQDYIFYEIHIGTFSASGDFDGILQRLDQLQDLGITAIELMPVAHFPGNRNWGYDGVYPFAVHTAYGGPSALKKLVNACHNRGLAVVLDVVYNHLGPEGNYLSEFGPYFTERYRTPWGPAINFDGPQSDEVVRYFVENALQWLDEFHIDALRLDAIHGIIDRSAQPFLACLSSAVEKLAAQRRRQIHLIAESDANDARFVAPRAVGGMGLDCQWSDDFHHALHSLQTGERDGYYVDFGNLPQLAKALQCGLVYDGQYSAYRKRRQGNSSAALTGRQFVVCSQNHDQVGNRMMGERSGTLLSLEAQKLSAATVLLSPYLPLLFMGEEFGETAPFLYFTSHGDRNLSEAVRAGRKKEFSAFSWRGEPPDPQAEATFFASRLNHEWLRRTTHRCLWDFYRELIRLRKTIPALRELNRDCMEVHTWDTSRLLVFRRWHSGTEVVVTLNFGEATERPPDFPAGTWRKLLDSADSQWAGPGSLVPESFNETARPRILLAPKSACLFQREVDFLETGFRARPATSGLQAPDKTRVRE